MNAIKAARKLITANPDSDSARVLSSLVLALESEAAFDINGIYGLEHDAFELAIAILKEWRLARYYAGKAKLFDVSYQVSRLSVASEQQAASP